jgi:hypothetical protein
MGPLRFVRLRPGLGPERARVTHLTDVEGDLVPWAFEDLPGSVTSPAGTLRVLCGAMLIPGSYDVLSGMAGMPCESCLINSPGPDSQPAIPQARRALPPPPLVKVPA